MQVLQKAASTNFVSSAGDELQGDTEKQCFSNIVNSLSENLWEVFELIFLNTNRFMVCRFTRLYGLLVEGWLLYRNTFSAIVSLLNITGGRKSKDLSLKMFTFL